MVLEFVSAYVVSPLLQDVYDRFRAMAADRIRLVKNSDIETEQKKLESTYALAQRKLSDVDGWDLIASNLHRDWFADVRRACYDAEDYIDHLNIEILNGIGDANFISGFFKKLGVSNKLQQLQGNLDRLITESDKFHNPQSTRRRNHHPCMDVDGEPMFVLDDKSFKRPKEKNEIVAFFQQLITGSTGSCCSSSSSSMMTVVISGMFGIGKTTLAQAVKNEPQIQGHFHHRLWVSVSGKFDLDMALRSMVIDLWEDRSKVPGSRCQPLLPSKLPVVTRIFQDLCNGKQVLVVLDDLCSFGRCQEGWKEFEYVLCKSSNSKFGVIVTTRNPMVATTVASLSRFPTLNRFLQLMSDQDCGLLILHKANPAAVNKHCKRTRCGKNILQTQVLEIAQKFCKGLPLVADIIGDRLLMKPDVATWSIMLHEDLWDMPEFREKIFRDFRLNYSDLSMSCLPYFSLFPKDYSFKKEGLVWLWLAEGFIRPQVTGVQYVEYPHLEELGSYAFDEVLSRSILQIHSPFDQEPQVYRMHEFIRRYAQCIGSDMYVRIDEQFLYCSVKWANVASQLGKARHISFLCQSIPERIWRNIEKCEGLRTMLSLHKYTKIGQISYSLFLKLRWLRVLVLSRTDINKLPESLGQLKHLGLLDVSETRIAELPGSTADLRRLHVLKLNQCSQLRQLPTNIEDLTQLLHLEVDMMHLSSMPPHIGKLSNLRALGAFKVGREDGHRVTELKKMKYIRGSICITNLENVRDEAEAREAKLSDKPFLKRAELEWKRNLTDQSLAEQILSGFEPHENLEVLQLIGYGGARFPNWLSSRECKLTEIHFLRCDQCCILPALGNLQYIKALHIEEMHRVRYIDHQFFGRGAHAGFPSLESLRIHDMRSLERWEGLQPHQMRILRDLVITECEKLTSLPALDLLASLVKLEITNCPQLQTLPEEGLPLSLETLIIVQCDLLKQRCLPEKGADRAKIRAVPNIFIDFERISSHGL